MSRKLRADGCAGAFSFGLPCFRFSLLIASGRKPTAEFDGEIGAELAFQSQLACIVRYVERFESQWAAKISGGSVME